jgi:hypothetical protein
MSPSKRVVGRLIVVATVLLVLCASASAAPLVQSAALTNPAGDATGFGTSVTLSSDGQTAVVGAPQDGDGAAYVYTRQDGAWSQTAALTNPAATATGFGTSVAISGATVVVGAPQADSAYVYATTGGAPTATLTDPAGAGAGTGFGTSVAISGSDIVVGAPQADSAYVYATTGGAPTATLTDPAGAGTGTGFGTSVAISGANIVVGAPNGANAYVYTTAGGSPTATLTPPTAAASFGTSVAISGANIVVGAPTDGNAYVYPTTGGSPTATLTNPPTFGSSVAISGTTAIVGDPSGGNAYVYLTTGASPTATLTNPATFGASVAIAGTTAVVGDPSGANAYVYTPPVAISTTVEDSSTGQPWAGTETTGAFTRDAATVTGQNGAPTGTVTYALYDSPTCSGVAAQTNSTNVDDGTSDPFGPLHAGSYGFTATYSGDGTYGAATGACEPFTVGRAPTALAATATPSTLSYGNTVILSAAGLPTAATGTMAFTAEGTTLCTATVSSGAGACTTGVLPPGSYAVTASYSGDGDDQGATASTSFAISAVAATTFTLPPSITITAPANGATYTHDESLRARFECVDGANAPGISSCDGTVRSGAPIDTSSLGTHGFTVTALSRSGESTIRTVHYTVKLPANRIVADRPSLNADGRGAVGVTVPGPGRLSGVETAWPANQREPRAGHQTVLSRGALIVKRAGKVTLHLAPGAVGRRLLAGSHGRRLRLRLAITFVPTGGTARQVSASGLVRIR